MIPHNKLTIDEEEISAVSETLRSGWIIRGEKTQQFEKQISSYIGKKYGFGTNSGTSALHLSLKALGIGEGDEVIIPTYVCTALLDAASYVKAKIKIVDVNSSDGNINVESLKKAITGNTKAIIVPHMFGMPADIDKIVDVCGENNVFVIEDCAQAIGAELNGRKVGSFGDLSVFSFYASKLMTTVQGGMILSDNREIIDNFKDMTSYDKQDYKPRHNYQMNDVQAAMGLSQFAKLNEFITKRRSIAQTYNNALYDLCQKNKIKVPVCGKNKKHIYYRYIIQHKDPDVIINCLAKEGIRAIKPVFKPLHKYFNLSGFENAENLHKTSVSIPIYPLLKDEEADHIIKSLVGLVN